ncbi:MAG: RNA polymerase subunit sigma-24 [Bacteroidetes bacterium HGW-Bacteroidetes-14]|jgi:RNA polymerase sigma-70 factor (ECF subfamily)|nr:MAG: RNA polymerase subunit sigma-24 [Bacteroidetes bacterium HGW-Bacteroidetes-14]
MEETGLKHIKKYSDKRLVTLVLQNREEASWVLVSRYQDKIRKFIMQLIHDPDDASDISQEAFEKAFQMIGSYDPHYAFSTWLYTIARNSCIDFMRRKKLNVRSLDSFTAGEEIVGKDSYVPSPEEHLIFEQEIEKLKREIENLPELYRAVAEMRFIHEYAYEEIAKELNLPSGTVKTRIRRAKEHLHKNGRFDIDILS